MAQQDNIKVAIRIRPLISREESANSSIRWQAVDDQIINTDGTHKPFQFDRVFDKDSTTDDVYKEVASPVIEGAMQGFHGTIFAYGQTASGKTFTMMGNEEFPGIIPQAINQIFMWIETSLNSEFLIRVSYLEIYNENVVDLLGDVKKHLDVRESANGQVFVNNLKEEVVINPETIFELMQRGEASRHYGSTSMNERSSRSHTIFRVVIESRERSMDSSNNDDKAIMVSHLNLVDLAGSEKARQTGATGQRLQEGSFINKSLLTLGQVISNLSEKAGFVNYRDSKLTRILQNSLGGNSKTAIIGNITPASLDETFSTLRFATSAKKITNKAVVNEVLSDEAMLRRYKLKISKLEGELVKIKEGGLQKENQELEQMLAANQRIQQEQEDKIERLKAFICVSSGEKDGKMTTPVQTFKDKRKRRETWCPGKGRSAMPPLDSFRGTLHLPEPSHQLTSLPETFKKRHNSDDGRSPMRAHTTKSRSLELRIAPISPLVEEEAAASQDPSGTMPPPAQPHTSSSDSTSPTFAPSLSDELAAAGGMGPGGGGNKLEDILQEISIDESQSEWFNQCIMNDVECQTEPCEPVTVANTLQEHPYEETVIVLQDQLDEQQSTIDELQSALKSREAELEVVNVMADENLRLQQENENKMQQQKLELEERIRELEAAAVAETGRDARPESMSCEVQTDESIVGEETKLEKKEVESVAESQAEELIAALEALKKENAYLKSELNEAVQMSETLINHMKTETDQRIKIEDSMQRLRAEYNELQESYLRKESEYNELQEFTRFERDYRNESILAKKHRLSSGGGCGLEDDLLSQSMLQQTDLNTTSNTNALLMEEVKSLRQEIDQLTNEKADAASLQELEHKKFVRRESELKDQLESVYAEGIKTSQSGQDSPDGDKYKVQVNKLEGLVEQLKEQLESLENEKALLEEVLKSEDGGVKELEEKILSLESELSITREKLAAVQETNVEDQDQAEKILSLESELCMTREKLAAVQEANVQDEDQAEKIHSLESELCMTREKLAAVQEANVQVGGCDEHEKKIHSLESELCMKREELAAAQELLQGEPTVKTTAFHFLDETERLDINEVDKLQLQSDQLKQNLQAVRDELKRTMDELDTRQEELVTNKQELDTRTEELDNALMELTNYKEECEALKSKVKKISGERDDDVEMDNKSEGSDKLTELKAHLESIKEECVEKEALLVTMKQECDKREADLKERKVKCDEYLYQLEDSRTKEQEAAQKLNEVEKELEQQTDSLSLQLLEMENEKLDLADKVDELEKELSKSASVSQHSSQQEDKDKFIIEGELAMEKAQHAQLRERYEKMLAESDLNKGKLLSEVNKDLGQQKRIEEQENARKEVIANFSKLQKENQEEIEKINKQLYEANCQIQKHRTDSELATHKLSKANEEIQKLKQEVRFIEDVHSRHEQQQHRQHGGHVDVDKLSDQLKKMNVRLDLTQQRLTKYEAENKELKAQGKKNEDAVFERNNLQSRLRDTQHLLDQKQAEVIQLQQRYSNTHTDMAQLNLQNATLQDKLHRAVQEKSHLQQNMASAEGGKDDLVQAKEKLMKEMQALKDQHSEMMKLNKQLEDKVEELEVQLAQAPSGDVMENLIREHEIKLQLKVRETQENEKSHWTAIMDKKVAEHQETIADLQMQLSSAPSEEMLDELKLKHADEVKRKIAEVQRDETAHWQGVMEKKIAEKQEIIEDMKVQIQSGPTEDLIEKMKEETEQKVREIQEQEKAYWEELLQKKEKEAEEEFNSKLEHEIRSLRDLTMEKLSQEQDALVVKHRADVEAMEEKQEMLLVNIRGENQTAMEQVEGEYLEIIECMKESHRNEMHTLKQEIDQMQQGDGDMEKLKEESNQMQEKHREEINQIQEKHQEEIDQKQEKHQEEIDQMLEKHQEEIDQIQENPQEDINQVQEKYREEINQMQEKHQEEIDQMKNEMTQILQELNDAEMVMVSKEVEIEELEQKQKELVNELRMEVLDLKQKSCSLHTKHGEEMEKLHDEHKIAMETAKISYEELAASQGSQVDEVVVTKYKEEIQDQQELIDRLKESELSLQADIEVLEGKVSDLETETRKEVDQKNEQMEMLQTKIEDICTEKEVEMESLRVTIAELEEEKEKLMTEVSEVKSSESTKMQDFEADVARKNEALCSLEDKLKKATEQLSGKDVVLCRLEDELQEVMEERTRVVKELECVSAKLSFTGQELEAREQGEAELAKELSRLQGMLEEDKGNREQQDTEVKELQDKIRALEEHNKSIESSRTSGVDEFQDKVSKLENALKKAKTEESFLEGCCNDLCEKLQEQEKKCKNLEEAVEKYQADEKVLMETQESIEILKGKLAEKDLKIQEIRRDYEKEEKCLMECCDESDKELEEEKAKCEQLQKTVEDLNKQLVKIEKLRQEEEKFLKECCDEAEDDLRQEKDKCETLENTIRELQADDAVAKLVNLKEMNMGLEADCDHLKRELERANRELTRTKASFNETQQKIQGELCDRKGMKDSMLKVQLRADALETELKQTREKLHSCTKMAEQWQENYRSLQNEVRRLKNSQLEESVVEQLSDKPRAVWLKIKAEQTMLGQENMRLKDEIEKLKSKLATKEMFESDLRQQLRRKEGELKGKDVMRSSLPHKKQLGEDQSRVLSDVLNSRAGQPMRRGGHSMVGDARAALPSENSPPEREDMLSQHKPAAASTRLSASKDSAKPVYTMTDGTKRKPKESDEIPDCTTQ